MVPSERKTRSLLVLAFFLIAGVALAADGVFPPLVNWREPASFSPHGAARGASKLGDITNPLLFVAVNPCRQFDSRNSASLPQNVSSSVVLSGNPCGLPTNIAAVSINITIFNISGASGNGVFQVGTGPSPTFAWINFAATETQRSNAGVLPVDGSTQVWVRVQMGGGQLDYTIDVNGYYPAISIRSDESIQISGDTYGPLISGINFNSSPGPTSGLQGIVVGTGVNAAGVLGQAGASVGIVYGVFGVAGSSSGFGVKGSNVIGVGISGDGGSRGIEGNATGSNSCGVCGVGFATASSSGVTGIAGTAGANAVLAMGDLTATGTKSFVDPDPSDPTKQINYISLEGPTAGTYFNGRARTVRGTARIVVPDHFRAVTDSDGITVQATPIGQMANFAVLKVDLYEIWIQASRDVDFFYTVYGIRATHKDHIPVEENTLFRPDAMAGAGDILRSLSEGQKKVLIENQVLNPDGTWNRQMVERLGWKLPAEK
jgi:hypothetical protein